MRDIRAISPRPDRRQFLGGGLAAGAGLVLGLRLRPASARAAVTTGAGGELVPNAFVRIAPDDTVTVISKHIEFGQGTYTGLATILAEELDADWSTVRVESAPAEIPRYANLAFGAQGTGGSTAMANSWEQMRRAGATARALLVAAAAETWGVAAAEIAVRDGVVLHAASANSARFGELAERAAGMTPPPQVELKDPSEFRLIGRDLLPRVDVPEKARGTALYTQDFRLPGMLTALVARPPRFGARAADVDATAALALQGVVEVVEIPQGVAVLAEGYWPARQGRQALSIQWDESAAERRGTQELAAEFRDLLDRPGLPARSEGNAEEALAAAETVISADYEFPYLAHAPMETLGCVIRRDGDDCDVWAGSQLQTIDHATVAAILGLQPARVRLHTLLAGGSFGRRATPTADVAAETAAIVKAAKTERPVKLLWSREDDVRGGYYRPLVAQRLTGGLGAAGDLVAWRQRIVCQSIMKGTAFEAVLVRDGVDNTVVEGAAGLPYSVPNLALDVHSPEVGVPVLWWRSVGHTHNAFTTETFLDEIAHAAGHDPVELRRRLLADHPRHLAVLELAAEASDWGEPLPKGRARGVAVHESFGSFVAEVAEVTLDGRGMPRVERVVCAVDCGIAINPDNIRAQMESGIGYGLGAALHNELVIEEGRVRASNFHDYRSLRIQEMPRVEVHIVPSSQPPTGVGEPGLPPLAPAVANALFHLTGERVRRLPFRPTTVREG